LAQGRNRRLREDYSFRRQVDSQVFDGLYRALLEAEMARVRAQGWALVDQELEEGLRSLAVPLRDADGAVVAAVNLSTTTRRGTPAAIRAEILPHLRGAADDIERDLASVNRGGSARM